MPTWALNRCWNREGDKFTARARYQSTMHPGDSLASRQARFGRANPCGTTFCWARIRDRRLLGGGGKARLYSGLLSAGHIAIAVTIARVNDRAIAANADTK